MNPFGLQGLVTKAAKLGETAAMLTTNPTAVHAAALVASGCAVAVAAQSGFSKLSASFLAMRALAASTFGRGNEFWYEDDKALLKQLTA